MRRIQRQESDRAPSTRAVAVSGDVREQAFAERLVATAIERFGALHVAFNNAGTLGERGPTPEISADGWAHTIETNLTSAFYAAKYQVPAMLAHGGGSLIFTSTEESTRRWAASWLIRPKRGPSSKVRTR